MSKRDMPATLKLMTPATYTHINQAKYDDITHANVAHQTSTNPLTPIAVLID